MRLWLKDEGIEDKRHEIYSANVHIMIARYGTS